MKRLTIVALSYFLMCGAYSQFPTKKLSRSVTNSVENEIAPFLSMDGNTLIYSRKRAMDEIWKVQISKKVNGTWQRANELKILNTLPKLRLLGSYGLNIDATEIIFSSKRRGGIGNYDLWITKKQGNSWTAPVNLAKPVNSPDEEINPYFSVDGNYIYFITRKSGTENGKLMKCRRKGNNYSSPVSVPVGGDFFCMRIAADEKTMYLSKIVDDKTQFFISRFNDNSWSKATRIMDFDTSSDKYFALNSTNTNLLISAKKEETYDLFYCKLTDEYSASSVTKLSIKLPVSYIAQISGSINNSPIRSKKVNNLYLSNDQEYEVIIRTQDYFSENLSLDLTNETSSAKTLSPNLTKKTDTYEILNLKDVNSPVDVTALKDKLAILKETFKGNYSGHELVIYQAEIETDTVKSYEFNKDISYEKEVEIVREKQVISYDTLGVNEDNLPILKVDTTIVKETEMVTKYFPLFSNDKRNIWTQEVNSALKSEEVSITPLLIDERSKRNIQNSGVFLRPKL